MGRTWKMDESYIKVNGKWVYLYRAVDNDGDTIDFMLSQTRGHAAVLSFLKKVIDSSGFPEKANIDNVLFEYRGVGAHQ
ncbi:DDE-type integrase/transposase/recombinase [Yersinia mollaretii]|uniref:DDE-type integrase/transposase/recombinase n=1 Tax=Yersinia mollaretii TaxID=33060 RepID=UPI001643BCC9|nr:DDE-type integrase/transposase/recombinase [Yersinia mollaretii]